MQTLESWLYPLNQNSSLDKVPWCLQCGFKMLSLTSSLQPHLSLDCQLLVQGRNGSDCMLERLEVSEDLSIQAMAQEDTFLHKLWNWRWVPGPILVLTAMKL